MKDEFDKGDFADPEDDEYRQVTIEGLIKVLSILFVVGIYVVILLKILVLE